MEQTSAGGDAHAGAGFAAAFGALLIGAVAMGASPLFVRYAADEVGPFASAFWRMALAVPFLYAWMRVERANTPLAPAPARRSWRYPLLAGLAFTGDLFFWHISILNTSIANATFFATLMPVFVVGITWLVLRQSVARSSVVGIVICLAGGGILVGKTMSVNPENLRGDLYGIVTAFFFALYFLAIGQARKSGSKTAELTCLQTCVTALALLAIALIDNQLRGSGLFPVTGKGIASLTGLALISQIMGQGMLTLSLGRLPTVFSSLVIFIEAVTAAILGWAFLNEEITLAQLAGGALILAGIWIARPKKSDRNGA